MTTLFQPWKKFDLVHKLHKDQIGAYILRHVESEKVYVGATGDLYGSLSCHASWLRNDAHYSKSLQTLYDNSPAFAVEFIPSAAWQRNREVARRQADEMKYEFLDLYAGSTLLLNSRMAPGSRQARPVRVADRLFPSLNAAARYAGVSPSLVKSMVEDEAFALWEYAVLNPETARISHGA